MMPTPHRHDGVSAPVPHRPINRSFPAPLSCRYPPPDAVERLERISPGYTEAILEQWRRQLEHQRSFEVRGQRYAFAVAVLGLLLSFAGIATGSFTHQPAGSIAGGVVGVVDLVALVTVFLRGTP